MYQFSSSSNKKSPKLSGDVSGDFYQDLKNMSSTIISLQYTQNQLLTFKVSEASNGQVVRHAVEDYSLQCQIRDHTYVLTQEHLDQLSSREFFELFDHLGLDHSEFLYN